MIEYSNECCGCATPSYPCIGDSCKNRHVPHLICDKCKCEVDDGDLRDVDGEQICVDCLLEMYPAVRVD